MLAEHVQDIHNQRLKISIVWGQSGGSHITSHSITETFQRLKVAQVHPPRKAICFRFSNLNTGGCTTAAVQLVSYSCYLFPLSDLQLATFSCCMPACCLKELSAARCLLSSSCLIQHSRKQSCFSRFKSVFCKTSLYLIWEG